MRAAALATLFLAAQAANAAEQKLPDCAALNRLWLSSYRAILKPAWPAAPLACAKS